MAAPATYLVCGGGGAIGKALSGLLVARGAEVISAGRTGTYQVDFTNPDGVATALKECGSLKSLRGVAYCVGSATLKPLRAAKPTDFLDAFNLNCLSAIETVKAVLPALRKNNGSVVLFSSVAAQHGFTNHSVISASKGAVEGITKALAAELAPSVRVNCVAPSLTDKSAITAPLTSNEKLAASIAEAHPLPRLGQPLDSAHAAAFLLSEESSWITGNVLACDGGRSNILLR